MERGKDYVNNGEEVVQDAGQSIREFARQGHQAENKGGRSAQEFAKHAQEEAYRQATG